MTVTTTPYRSTKGQGKAGFAQMLRAEWTKFHTVRGWLVGVMAGAAVVVLLGYLAASGTQVSCGDHACPIVNPAGPDGEGVTDTFYFLHRSLEGDGSITVPVVSLAGSIRQEQGPVQAGTAQPFTPASPQPWAKAGLIVKESTRQGSVYAAIMLTGGNGVRLQYDYIHDKAGSLASARWLRLTRRGSTLLGEESPDGTHWTQVGTARLPGLGRVVQAGLFVASPVNMSGGNLSPTRLTATFGDPSVQGNWSPGVWTGGQVGLQARGNGGYPGTEDGGGTMSRSGSGYTLTAAGDIAPTTNSMSGGVGGGDTVEQFLVGTFVALVVIGIIGALYVTGEYRRGLIRTTFLASPRRGRVLVAKAIVLAAVTFVAGLVAVLVTMPLTEHILKGNGGYIYPTPALIRVRVIVGTAALLSAGAVLALALGALLRRGAAAIAATLVLLVLPYFLGLMPFVPTALSKWLLRLTPAAGFAIQQSISSYHQVLATYTPMNGYYPLAPWAGFAVLCGWVGVVLALAVLRLNRRDA